MICTEAAINVAMISASAAAGSFVMDLVLALPLQVAWSLHNLRYKATKICNGEVVMTTLQVKILPMGRMTC